MFDIGMTELLVVAVVAIVVVGPKDLPGLLRNAAKYIGQIRSMARDFQGQISEAIKDTELDSVRDTLKGVGDLNPANKIKSEVQSYMDSARSFDEPDEDHAASAEAIDSGTPEKSATETATIAKPVTEKTPKKKVVAKKTVAKKAVAKKPAATKKNTATAKKAPPKRAASKASS